jgi:hypothetical protein
VASRTGLGSTFTVLLPAATDAAAEAQVDSTGGLLSAALGAPSGETPAAPRTAELALGRLRD